jgi:hypothetical protein
VTGPRRLPRPMMSASMAFSARCIRGRDGTGQHGS